MDATVDDWQRRKHDFRRLMAGATVSLLGSRLTAIGFPLLVLALTGSPLAAGWAGFAATAPSAIVYLPAGALVDRWDPRWVMIVTEICRGLTIATVVLSVALGRPSVALLIGLAVVEATLGVFSALAERRFIATLVDPGKTAAALARVEGRAHVALLLGRPLGGLLFGLGRLLPFLADAVSFVVSAVALAWTRPWLRPAARPAKSLRAEISEGLAWLRSDPFARVALLLTAATTLIGQALIMVFLAAAQAYQLAPVWIGAVLGASGAGGIAGSATAERLFRKFGYSLLTVQIWIWSAAFMSLTVFGGRSFIGIAAVLASTGFAGALGNVATETYLMNKVEATMLGRITSVDRLTSFCAVAAGPLLGGALAAQFGQQASIRFLLVTVLILLAVTLLAGSSLRPKVTEDTVTATEKSSPNRVRPALAAAWSPWESMLARIRVFCREVQWPGIDAPKPSLLSRASVRLPLRAFTLLRERLPARSPVALGERNDPGYAPGGTGRGGAPLLNDEPGALVPAVPGLSAGAGGT